MVGPPLALLMHPCIESAATGAAGASKVDGDQHAKIGEMIRAERKAHADAGMGREEPHTEREQRIEVRGADEGVGKA